MKFKITEQKSDNKIIMRGNAAGHEYTVYPDFISRDGKPYIYKMGEFHYSRYPECDWKKELMKMKAGGIDIVASYVLWNHHEEHEGEFNFSGRCNIREFIDICEKLKMPFFLRIGPWAHGEARWGGFPDWLVEKGFKLRSTDEGYIKYVRRLFEKIYEQVGSSKNIIGIQVENELTKDPDYLELIRKMLLDIGFEAPLWTATAWGRAKLPEKLLPMFGGYPEAPWEGHTNKLAPNPNYFFSYIREDGLIGSDMLGKSDEVVTDKYAGKYPFLTCELGGGNQCTYQRRPVFNATDISALAVCKLGSGANGLGYYMYHGGVNPVYRDKNGKLVTFQECKCTQGSDYPIVSYDFQAPLGDCGQMRDSYFALCEIHRFVDTVGENLALMKCFLPNEIPSDLADTKTPRVALRSDGKSGFVFYNNHIYGEVLSAKSTQLEIDLQDKKITIPLDIPADSCGMFPFEFKIGEETVKYVKAMPIECTDERVVFLPLCGIEPTVCFNDGKIKKLSEVESIGGVKVKIAHHMTRSNSVMPKLEVTKKPNQLDFEAFEHITRVKLQDQTSEYEVEVPDKTEYLCVKVEGDIAVAYSMPDKRLLSDHYCDGDDWYIDVRGVKTVRIKIQPLTSDVYAPNLGGKLPNLKVMVKK